MVNLYNYICIVKVKSLSRVRLFVTPWTVAYEAPPSMGFSRQEYWSGLPFPSPYTYVYICIHIHMYICTYILFFFSFHISCLERNGKNFPGDAEAPVRHPGRGTKTPYASWPKGQNINQKQYCKRKGQKV